MRKKEKSELSKWVWEEDGARDKSIELGLLASNANGNAISLGFVFWFRFQIRVWVKGFLLSLCVCVCGNLSLSVCVCVSLQHNSQIKTLAESAEWVGEEQ